METQMSTETTETQIELNIDEAELLEDNERLPRRAHIDVLIIFLVCAFSLGFVLDVYGTTEHAVIKHPTNNNSGNFSDFLVDEDKYTILPLDHWNWILVNIAWHYLPPLLFFLSGWNAFYSLCKRTEREFRIERVHRLLVPILTIYLLRITEVFSALAPMDLECQLEHEFLKTKLSYNLSLHYSDIDMNRCQGHRGVFHRSSPLVQSMISSYQPASGVLSTGHLIPLFLFSQMFAFWFCVFHPRHNKQSDHHISYCGSTSCCCSKKPLSCATKTFCCLNFLCKPASNPTQFIDAVSWYLGGPLRLILVPCFTILLIDSSDQILSLFIDIGAVFEVFVWMCFYLFGYAIAATEFESIGELCKKYCSIYLSLGVICILGDSIVMIVLSDSFNKGMINSEVKLMAELLHPCFRGFGSWLFVLGAVNTTNKTFKTSTDLISKIREISMPFFMIHPNVFIIYMAGAFWIPYFRSFPFTIIFGTLTTGAISFVITKAGPIRYFFGLHCPKNSLLPGVTLGGFIPLIVLIFLSATACSVSFAF